MAFYCILVVDLFDGFGFDCWFWFVGEFEISVGGIPLARKTPPMLVF
jgi:hypothetical protein